MKLTSHLRAFRISSRNKNTQSSKYALPVDMIEEILECLISEREFSGDRAALTRDMLQPTLCAAALVCRTWKDVATKYLYREIHLSSLESMQLLAHALEKYSSLPPLVRDFVYTKRRYVIGYSERPFTPSERYTYKRVHDLCPNLYFSSGNYVGLAAQSEEACHKASIAPANSAARLSLLHPSRLTALELSIPEAAVFRNGGCSNVVLPELRTLYLEHLDQGDPVWQIIDWFIMPQLRRLVMKGFNSGLKFPQTSPLITCIEILGGRWDLYETRYLFHQERSPFLLYKDTLESLTIISNARGCGRTDWSLGFLTNLAVLTLSIENFVNVHEISDYPPRLREFVLVSGDYKSLWFVVDEQTRKAYLRLRNLLYNVPSLKRVKLFLWKIKKYPLFYKFSKTFPEIEFTIDPPPLSKDLI